jgi:hypothetical protein
MRFINKTLNPKVTDAIYLANNLLASESKLITDIRYKNDWKYNTPANFIDELLKVRPPISVFFYRSFNPFTKVLGYYQSGQININVKKVSLESFATEDLVGLLLHEYAHYCGFTHGNNYKTQDKVMYSVPYYLSENIKNWL